jgi:hypothetical protein
MNRNVNKLSIRFLTNIPNKKEIVFTRKLLYHPDLKSLSERSLSQYPYLVTNQMYKVSVLRSMRYADRVSFFFSETKMLENTDAFLSDMIDETDIEAINTCVRNNVLAMLESLFPTKYPRSNDVKNSFDVLNHLPDELPGNPTQIEYSYLKDGKPYTFRSLIWLNDILNHPKYNALLKSYVELDKMVTAKKTTYLSRETRVIDEKINDIQNAIRSAKEALTKEKVRKTKQILVLIIIISVIDYIIFTSNSNFEYDEFMDSVKENVMALLPNQNFDEAFLEIEKLLESIQDTFDSIADLPPKILKMKIYKDVQSIFRKYLFDESTKQPTKKLIIKDQRTDDLLKKKIYHTLQNVLFDTSLDALLQEFNEFQSLYEISLKNPKLGSYANKYPVYRQFVMTLQSLVEPRMSSSNGELQKLLNCETKDTALELYSFLQNITGYYFKGERELDPDVRKKSAVGITSIAVRAEDDPRLEIYVLGDFLGGELNDDKMKTIKCKIEGERLGDEFLDLMSKKTVPHPWNVNTYPMFLDVDTLKSSESSADVVTTKKEVALGPVQGPGPERNLPGVSINDINAWFFNEIRKEKNKPYLEKLEKLFTEKNVTGEVLSIDTLVNWIQKKNTELYGRLADATKQQYAYSSELRKKLNALMLKYNSQVKLLQDDISEQKRKLNDASKLDKLTSDLVVYKIYEVISEFLFEIEKKKEGLLMSAGSPVFRKKKSRKHANRKLSNRSTRRFL